VAKQRRPFVASRPNAEQFRVERICQVARAAARLERVRAPVQAGALPADEVLPRVFVAVGARAGKRQVFEMERREIRLDLL
jgi:hypothetical protein